MIYLFPSWDKLEGKKSSEILAEQVGQKNQIFRYIRLTELISELMDMVDGKEDRPEPCQRAVLSQKEEQVEPVGRDGQRQATPSFSKPSGSKNTVRRGILTLDTTRVIMGEEKKSDPDRVTFTSDTLRRYFLKAIRPSGCRKPSSSCWRHGRKSVRETRNDERSRL